MKRKIAMMLAVMCLMFSMSTVSQAAGEPEKVAAQPSALGEDYGIQPFYVNAALISSSLKIDGSTAYCNAQAAAKKVCTIKITMRLQRKNGSSWYTVKSWSESATTSVKDMTKTYTLVTRGSYRVYAIFNVGGESLTYTSPTKTF